jgi:site-specific recombinase XerD
VWIELLAYLHESGTKKGLLFRTDVKKTRHGVTSVGNIVKKYAHIASLDDGVTPKTLRHTFASHLMDAGVDISIISSLMGHKSPRETGVYLHAYKKNKDSAVKHFDNILEEE